MTEPDRLHSLLLRSLVKHTPRMNELGFSGTSRSLSFFVLLLTVSSKEGKGRERKGSRGFRILEFFFFREKGKDCLSLKGFSLSHTLRRGGGAGMKGVIYIGKVGRSI